MGTVMVDSNVILDVFTEDPNWGEWSSEALRQVADQGRVVINAVIFAEISIRIPTIEEVDEVFPASYLEREPIPFEAAFLAGKCFSEYRKRGGSKAAPLPDFFIGAHAAIGGYQLLTRDVSRYRTYFPKLEMIAPEVS